MSNEELYLTRELFRRHLRGEIVVPVERGEPRRMKNGAKEWHAAVDSHPNSEGARRLGLRTVDAEGLSRFLYGAADATIIMDPDAHPFLASKEALQLLRVGPTITFARREHAIADVAAWLLPVASLASNDGTFTSSTGVVQRFAAAFQPRGEAQPLWTTVALLAREMGAATLDFRSPAEVFAALAGSEKAFAGAHWESLSDTGERSFRERQHVG